MVGRNPKYIPTVQEKDDEYADAVEERVYEQFKRHQEETDERFDVEAALERGRANSGVGSTHFDF